MDVLIASSVAGNPENINTILYYIHTIDSISNVYVY